MLRSPYSRDVSDQPRADWYTDPEDSSQYRYWDGSAWTEHRAPRHTEPQPGPHTPESGLRPAGQLISGSFALVRRLWRGLLLAAAVTSAGIALAWWGSLTTANRILDGRLDEILDRISEPDFDPNAPEHEEYFSSLTYDWSPGSFVPLTLGSLIAWLVIALVVTAVIIASASDLDGRAPTLAATLRQTRQRILRMMGVQLKIAALLLAAIIILLLPAIVSPWLLLLTVPAMLAVAVVWGTVLQIAFVVAATGPAKPSIRYTLQLVRGRFWGTFGRLLLVGVIVTVIAFVIGLSLSIATGTGEEPFHVVQLIDGVIAAMVGWVATAATVIVYRELGGESG